MQFYVEIDKGIQDKVIQVLFRELRVFKLVQPRSARQKVVSTGDACNPKVFSKQTCCDSRVTALGSWLPVQSRSAAAEAYVKVWVSILNRLVASPQMQISPPSISDLLAASVPFVIPSMGDGA